MADVLVVDDDADIRDSLRLVLESERHHVLEASDGTSALALLRTHPTPLVVVLDWYLPVLDGIQMLHSRAGDVPRTHHHAYILLTAARIDADHPLPKLPGVLDVRVMRKPFDVDALLAEVREAAARIGRDNA